MHSGALADALKISLFEHYLDYSCHMMVHTVKQSMVIDSVRSAHPNLLSFTRVFGFTADKEEHGGARYA